MDQRVLIGGSVVGVLLLGAGAVWMMTSSTSELRAAEAVPAAAAQCLAETGSEVWVAGREFAMGDDATYPEEGPVHTVRVDGFWIDTHEVTNAQYAAFVAATGYVTVAERTPDPADWPGMDPNDLVAGSVVFTPPGAGQPVTQWWSYIDGANWRHPKGPGTSIEGRENYPVVHIAFEDAQAYADWAGRSLPTEAEYELAARSGRDGEHFAWGGEDLAPEGEHQANTWQGIFPIQNTGRDGYVGYAPVGCFNANDYGAYDMIGNVWEWTGDWYAPAHDTTQTINPTGVTEADSFDPNNQGFPVRVLKGGSFLCAPNFCMRYRPSARHAQDAGLGSNHIGFRTVSRRDQGASRS